MWDRVKFEILKEPTLEDRVTCHNRIEHGTCVVREQWSIVSPRPSNHETLETVGKYCAIFTELIEIMRYPEGIKTGTGKNVQFNVHMGELQFCENMLCKTRSFHINAIFRNREKLRTSQ